MLVTPLVALPWTATTGSAQPYSLDAEAVCSERPRHPACLAIFWHYCAQNPNEPVCLSDDDDDDDDEDTAKSAPGPAASASSSGMDVTKL
jgi:hypothetical protein